MSALGMFPADLYAFSCASQGTSRPNALKRYRNLYRGDRGETIKALREVYSSYTANEDREGRDTRRNYPILNELQVIINRRIAAMPTAFDVIDPNAKEGDEDTLADRFSEWASSPMSARGQSLYAELGRIYRDQELDGVAAVVVLPDEEYGARISVRDSSQLTVSVDSMTGRVEAAMFTWQDTRLGEPSEIVTYTQEFTATDVVTKRDGEQIDEYTFAHGMPEVPVVLVPREVEHGLPVGISGVAELEDAYLHFLWTAYLLNYANKHEAFGVYCPRPQSDDGSLLNLGEGGVLTQFQITPGSLYPVPIEKVGGNISVDSVMAQYERTLDTLYRLGKVKRDRDQNSDMRSGKAMLLDTQELKDYTRDRLVIARGAMERISDLWAWATGERPAEERTGLLFEFPSLDNADPAEMTKRGDLWLKAEKEGLATTKQRLDAWQDLGLVDDDADTQAMADEIEAVKDAAEADRMEQMAERLEQMRAQRPQVPPEQDEAVSDGAPA